MAAATAVAAALSLPFLTQQSLWLDEIFTRHILGAHSLAAIWRHIRATESTPPLYYLVAKLATDIAGTRSAAAMRLPSTIAFIACVPVGYLALRRLVGWRAALGAAAIIAVNPDLLQFAGYARSYALFVLAGLLSLWGFSAVLERGSSRRYAGWALASVACVWTHYFGVFLVGAEALVLLWALPDARLPTMAWCAAIAVGTAPLIPLLAHQNGSSDANFIAQIPLGTRLEATVRQFAMSANVPRAWLEGPGVAIAALGAAAAAVIAWRSRRRESVILIVVALIALAVPLLLSVTKIEDRFYARNVMVVLPLVAGVAALGLIRARGAPLALYLALCVITSLWVATDWRYQQLDWRGAVARMLAADAAAPVVTTESGNDVVVETYLGRSPVGSARASAIWVAVPPARGSGERALTAVPATPAVPGFRPARQLVVHGFRLVLERAPAAREVAAPAGTVLFGA